MIYWQKPAFHAKHEAFENDVALLQQDSGDALSTEDLHLISAEYVHIAVEVLMETHRKLKW